MKSNSQTGKVKSISLFMMVASLLMFSLTSFAQNGKYDDDVYYSPSKSKTDDANRNQNQNTAQPSNNNANDYSAKPAQEQNATEQKNTDSRFDYSNTDGSQPAFSTTEQRDGNTYVTNNYYEEDEHDYYYSSRIRRFHRPLIGYNYYDPFYTNSYWYDYNPYNYGSSIYLGYNWWAPSAWYAPSFCSFNIGYNSFNPYYSSFGWGFNSGWGYNPYNSWGYGGHGHGYHNGYANGYYDGYYNGLYNGYNNPYYFNSYDQLSYQNSYYGPRRNTGSHNKAATTPRSVGHTYYAALNKDVKNTLPVSNAFANSYSIPRPMNNNNTSIESATPRANTGGVKPTKNNAVKSNDVKGNDVYTSPGRPKGNAAADGYSKPAPVKENTGGVKPVRGNDLAPVTPKDNNNFNSEPRPKSNTNTPRNNDYNSDPRPKNNNEYSAPKNNDYNSEPRPRNNNEYTFPKNNENATPRPEKNYENSTPAPRPAYNEPAKPRNETPKSYDAPKPKQERNNDYQAPSRPSAPGNNTPAPRPSNNNSEKKRGNR